MDNSIEDNSYYNEIKYFDKTQFDILQQALSKSQYVVYWLQKGWKPSWFNLSKIQKLIDKGHTPIFHYSYFGDKLGSALPTEAEQEAYFTDSLTLGTFLNELNGTKLLIMEPEFNKGYITDVTSHQHDFATLIASAIDKIKSQSTGVLVSLCMRDKGRRDVDNIDDTCAYDNCALGDQEAWLAPHIVYTDLLPKLDFISFQEMLGQFHRDPDNKGTWSNPIPIANTENSSGIAFLPQRISNFAQFLRNTYKKPVFLSYISIATASWEDYNQDGKIAPEEIDPIGWENQAGTAYRELMLNKAELMKHNLFGLAVFSLFDEPQNNLNGYQYFMNNEYHQGVIKSASKDEIDLDPMGNIQFKSDIITSLFGDI